MNCPKCGSEMERRDDEGQFKETIGPLGDDEYTELEWLPSETPSYFCPRCGHEEKVKDGGA